MANNIYATINGKQQGLISAGCSTADSIGNKHQLGHENQILVLKLAHNPKKLFPYVIKILFANTISLAPQVIAYGTTEFIND